MPRNRNKRNQDKKAAQVAAERQELAQVPAIDSPAVAQVIERITGNENYMDENYIRIMTESENLAKEPEFLDLEFNPGKAATISERLLTRYEKKLLEAEKKGPDEFDLEYDRVRIEIIRELATPIFRKQVKERLTRLFSRLSAEENLDKLELVIGLQSILSTKDIPWGINGLILAIYNRSIKKILDLQQAEDEFDMDMESLFEGKSDEEILQLMQSEEALQKATEQLMAANPEQFAKVQDQALEIAGNFEQGLFEGKIALDLFTQEELDRPVEQLQQEQGRPIDEILASETGPEQLMETIRQTIVAVMTPERMQEMHRQAGEITQSWYEQNDPWAAALELEMVWLEGEQFEENKFLACVFLGQLARQS